MIKVSCGCRRPEIGTKETDPPAAGNSLQDYKEYHTHTTVHFIITLTGAGKDAIKKDGLEKAFKCVGKLSTSNMVMFDPHGKIKKYTTPEEVIEDFYDIRLDYYHKRKVRDSRGM